MNKATMFVMLIAAGAMLAVPTVSAADAEDTADAAGCGPTVHPDGSATVRCSGTPLRGCAWAQTAFGPGYAACFD